jgi:hypothetical protein
LPRAVLYRSSIPNREFYNSPQLENLLDYLIEGLEKVFLILCERERERERERKREREKERERESIINEVIIVMKVLIHKCLMRLISNLCLE